MSTREIPLLSLGLLHTLQALLIVKEMLKKVANYLKFSPLFNQKRQIQALHNRKHLLHGGGIIPTIHNIAKESKKFTAL